MTQSAFVYAPGALLGERFVDETDVAQDCRIGLPANSNTTYTAEGLRMFLNAVNWASGPDCGLQGHGAPVSPSLPNRMCSVDPAIDVEGTDSTLWVRAMEHDPGSNTLFMGGRFQQALGSNGSFPREGVFGCDLDSGTVTSFNPPIEIHPFLTRDDGSPENERIRALAFDGRYVYIGGKFRFDDSVSLTNAWDDRARYNLIRVDVRTNQVDTSWVPNIRGGVSALEIDGDWLYVAGGIFQADGTEVARLTRVSLSTGQNDPEFRPMFIPDVESDGTLFATVIALEISNGVLFAGGAFDYVVDKPDDAAWAIYSLAIPRGERLDPLSLEVMGAVRRNSVAAINLSTGNLTAFSPSIGDNNLGTDEIAQIRDIVADGQGHVFVCGDWWVTNAEGNRFWTPFDYDAGQANPNGAGWEGQLSKHQPRPNQHNFGKFEVGTGDSVVVGGRIWGAVTDGGHSSV